MAIDDIFSKMLSFARGLRPSVPPEPPRNVPDARIPSAPRPLSAPPQVEPVHTESDLRVDVEGVVTLPIDETSALVRWSLDGPALDAPAAGELVLRLVVFAPDDDAIVREETHERVVEGMGEWRVSALPEGAHIVAALGQRDEAGGFTSLAHAAPLALHKKG